ncbi:MAG TPA: hypothetical protein VGH16_06835 [Candidatus Binatia bacterium]|jgi:hypothetical protein
MRYREYFINGVISAIAIILLAWGVSSGTLSRLDAVLIAAVLFWPFAMFYCFRLSGLGGMLMKIYAFAPPVIAAAWYFNII